MTDFLCPVCKKPLERKGGSYYCSDGHCFDIARSGYVNLLPVNFKHTLDPGDAPEMITARARIMELGYYDKLYSQIKRLLPPSFNTVIDAGSGEGTLTEKLALDFPKAEIFGIDISKHAVNAAAKRRSAVRYAVASANKLPFPDGSADVALCAFAPLFRDEIGRIMKSGGTFIRILAGERHLFGLKTLLYDKPYENTLPDEQVSDCLLTATVRLSDSITVKGGDIMSLLTMTPYYFNTPREAIERLAALETLTTNTEFVIKVYIKN